MAVQKTVQAQRDFSAGEIDADVKRSDQAPDTAAILKAGLRQARNLRILNSKAAKNRPGRLALQLVSTRVDEITIEPGLVFRFNFTTFAGGSLNIYDTVGRLIASRAALGWSETTIDLVTWAVIDKTVHISAPGIIPQFTTWNGVAWSTPADFAPLTTTGGQKRTFFYRLSPRGVTMLPSATTGVITLTFNVAIPSFNAGIIGTYMRYCGRQILVTGFTSTSQLSGTVIEALPPGQLLSTGAVDPRNLFSVGDEIVGTESNARGIVTALAAAQITVQLLQVALSAAALTGQGRDGPNTGFTTTTAGFGATEVINGPGGSLTLTAVANTVPQAVAVWDEEVMNNFRGWPGCVFSDQSRLGFCNFPALPSGIGWSAIASPTDCYVDALASSAMLELAPDKVQIYYVLPGAESSEFVFCDTRIFYIPITPSNPLRPGSVAFQTISAEGAAQVQPRRVQEVLVYINAGKTSVMSIVALGATNRPYETRNLSELHSHLIVTPIAIAAPTAINQFEERYLYILNSDGTLAVGRYSMAARATSYESGQIAGVVGWTPWSGEGDVRWVSARDSQVLFVTLYENGVSMLESVDSNLYLDCAVAVNFMPVALAAPAGKGPLWFIPGQSVDLMDQGTRMMGTYQVDNNGNLVPQNRGGEDLSAHTLIAGKAWTATVEPFVPAVQPGDDRLQRMRKRRICRAEIYVKDSTGFRVDTIKADDQSANLPAVGTVSTSRRVPAWNQGDNPTSAPMLREQAYGFKPTGRAHDPRIAVVKDTPGPLTILEIGLEVSV